MELITINISSFDKEEFERICNDAEISINDAINLFIKGVIKEQKLPFAINLNLDEKEIIEKLLETEEEMKTSNIRYSWEEVLKYLKK